MMSGAQIAAIARQVAVKASAYELEPYVPANPTESLQWKVFPIPNLGEYRPAGWRLEDSKLVDVTGMGYEGEGALTQAGFVKWVSEIVRTDPQAGFGIIEEGQFQVVVGYFTPDSEEAGSDFIEWETCPNCSEPVEVGEEYCPWCDFEMHPEPAPFQEGDQVVFTYQGKLLTGTVIIVNEMDEQCTVEWEADGETNILDVYWDGLKLDYNPADDPNQMRLPLPEEDAWAVLGSGLD